MMRPGLNEAQIQAAEAANKRDAERQLRADNLLAMVLAERDSLGKLARQLELERDDLKATLEEVATVADEKITRLERELKESQFAHAKDLVDLEAEKARIQKIKELAERHDAAPFAREIVKLCR